MMARAYSGSRSSIISVEPLMSANSAVTVLRSPSRFSGAGVSATRIGESLDRAAEAVRAGPSAAAHSPQKSSPGSLEAPHCGHKRASGAAHLAQNLRPSRLSFPHFEQCIALYPAMGLACLYHPTQLTDSPSRRRRRTDWEAHSAWTQWPDVRARDRASSESNRPRPRWRRRVGNPYSANNASALRGKSRHANR
jgi:hypothetical protein